MALKSARTLRWALERGWMGLTLRRTTAPLRPLVKTTPPAFLRASPTTAEKTIFAM
jgi:hypothetical protein